MTTILPPPPGTTDIDAYVAEQLATVRTKEFNPDQPRDDQGRWTDSGGGSAPRELTAVERQAVVHYGGGGFYDINSMLRTGKTWTETATPAKIKEEIGALDSAIAAQPPTAEEHVLYRGLAGSPALTPGTVFADKGFISTSKSSDQAFAHGATLMEIHVPPGAKMLDVGDMATFREQEVILPRGSVFKVESRTTTVRPIRVGSIVAYDTVKYPLVKVSLQL